MNAKATCVAVWLVARLLLVADLDIRYDVPCGQSPQACIRLANGGPLHFLPN